MSASATSRWRLRWLVSHTATGPSPTSEDRNIIDGEWGVLKTTAVTWAGWDPKQHKVLPEAYWGNKSACVREGDIVVTKAGPRHRVGVAAYVHHAPEKLMVSGKMMLLRPNPAVADGRYLTWHLATPDPQAFLDSRKTGMAESQMNFANEDLLGMPLHLPDLEEQRRIADFLDAATRRIDALRDLSLRQTNLLAHRLQEMMRRETSTGPHRTIKTGIPWMPDMDESWKLFKIRREFRTASGTTPTSTHEHYYAGPHPWVNSSDVRDGVIDRVEKSVTEEALLRYSALKLIPAGSLVVALYGQGATKGRVGILKMDACLNQACCALIPSGNITTEFAYYWFRAHKEGIVAQAVGAGQPNLSQELMRELMIPAPDKSTQQEIVRRLIMQEAQTSAQIKLLQRRDSLLRERRQALITAAVTGQFDVSTASDRNVTAGVPV